MPTEPDVKQIIKELRSKKPTIEDINKLREVFNSLSPEEINVPNVTESAISAVLGLKRD